LYLRCRTGSMLTPVLSRERSLQTDWRQDSMLLRHLLSHVNERRTHVQA
jgi:hypothetical protein